LRSMMWISHGMQIIKMTSDYPSSCMNSWYITQITVTAPPLHPLVVSAFCSIRKRPPISFILLLHHKESSQEYFWDKESDGWMELN
jgi:hypothetical protein